MSGWRNFILWEKHTLMYLILTVCACVCVCEPLSRVWLFATPWTVAYQVPLSMGFSRQEYWSGLPFSSLGDLPNPGIELQSSALQVDSLLSEPSGKLPKNHNPSQIMRKTSNKPNLGTFYKIRDQYSRLLRSWKTRKDRSSHKPKDTEFTQQVQPMWSPKWDPGTEIGC